jgi:2',3'-cyclic-nucleotide 2'-phosphodiesterase (5'-nucleotidase family)
MRNSSLNPFSPLFWRSLPGTLSACVLAVGLASSGLVRADETVREPTTEFGTVIVRQNDELNTTTSITMFRGPGGSLNWEPVWLSSSRADYPIAFFHDNDFETGTMIGSVAENGRNNALLGDENLSIGEFRATVSVAASPNAGQPVSYRLATSGAFAPGPGHSSGQNGGEVNVNVSFGYFPYSRWLAGNAWHFARTNGARVDRLTGTEGLQLGVHLTNPANGRYELDLRSLDPSATPANGILLVSHAKDEDNFASSIANPNGTFTMRIKDNGSDGAGTEQDPVTFVYVPLSKMEDENIVAMGRVLNNGSAQARGGSFSVTNPSIGNWHLTIPGQDPNTGTLIISPGGAGNMQDNLISYQWNSGGYWVIQACDIISPTTLPVLENGGSAFEEIFSFVFFAAPQVPEVLVLSPEQKNTFVKPASFTVSAFAEDLNGQIERVQFFRNNRFIGEVTEPPYEVEEVDLPGGFYIYQARAIDNDGLAPFSTPVSVRVTVDPLNPPDNTAIFLDGLTEHARTLVVEPSLGVGGPPTKGFTLECWFRKEGLGATASSGSGGIVVQPLIAKGRGESDNNPTDCNYMFGVTLDGQLAADFEAFPTPGVVTGGANFPVFGTHEPIQNGRWYHAALTYDGVEGRWKIYLDGELVADDSSVPVGAMPRYDSNHRFAIGAAMNTSVVRAGSFFGAIDEVRVWDYVRTLEEIQFTKDASVVSAAGLRARYGMDEATGEFITSSSGTGAVAQLIGQGIIDEDEGGVADYEPLWIPGAPLTNQAPLLELTAPANGAVFVGQTPFLVTAEALDMDGEVVKVQFLDGANVLAEFTEGPYEFLWTNAPLGERRLRALAEDDQGAVTVYDVTITVKAASVLMLTEMQSAQSAGAPPGVADFWELTNFSNEPVSLAGYTWSDSSRNRAAAMAWALPAGTMIGAGESIVFTTVSEALFRAWWGLPASVRVIHSVGAPGLGQNDGVALYDAAGGEVFYFNYAPGGFTRGNGLPSLGGHAGTSGGGAATDALVWEPLSGLAAPRYSAASVGVNGAVTAATGADVGSPGVELSAAIDPPQLLVMKVSPAAFLESAANPAAVATLTRYGDLSEELEVQLSSSNVGEATVPLSVVIPAGEAMVQFDVTAVDDIQADGDQTVVLSGVAVGASLARFVVTVLDDGDLPPPALMLTEVQSNQSETAPAGAGDYWELTNYGSVVVDLEGFTWDDDRRSFALAQAWAFPAGTSLAPGESVVVTAEDPAAFRAWWGLDASVRVLQTPGSRGLGSNDGVALFDNNGRELFFFSYAQDGFLRPDGSAAAGGHAGVSGGGVSSDALVWDPASGVIQPRYVAAVDGQLGAFTAAEGTDVGSPGSGSELVPQIYTLQLLHFGDPEPVSAAAGRASLLAAMVEGYSSGFDNTLVLAGGDSFIPGNFFYAGADPLLDGVSSVGKTALGRAELAMLNEIGVEASGLGIHEWDLGSAVLAAAVAEDGDWAGAQFPILAANLDFSADPSMAALAVTVDLDGNLSSVPAADQLKGKLVPMTVIEKGGERIGLVGVTTQMLEALSEPSGTMVEGTNEVDLDLLAGQIQAQVDELQDEGVNKILLLSHLRSQALDLALAGRLRSVDVLLAAGVPSHTGSYPLVTQDALGEPMLLVSTGAEFSQLGRLVVDFDLDGRLVLESLPDYAAQNGLRAVTNANAAAAWSVSQANLVATAFAPGTRAAAVKEITDAVQEVWAQKETVLYGYSAVHLEGGMALGREETNLGNLVADANRSAAAAVLGSGTVPLVSLLHGAAIHTPIGGVVDSVADGISKTFTQALASVGKPVGAISQLDVESALRSNDGLMVFELQPQGLKEMLEYAVSEWPKRDRFPQVSGVVFAWDAERAVGDRITSISLVNQNGSAPIAIYKAGKFGSLLLDKGPPVIRVVAPSALANGGAGYPSKLFGEQFRYLLDDGSLGPVIANKTLDFTDAPQVPVNALGEQAVLAGYLLGNHGTLPQSFRRVDTALALDVRIQNLGFREDLVPPLLGEDSDGDGLSDLDEVVMGGNPFAGMRVGDYVDLDLSVWLSPGQIGRLVGRLPRGLRYDPATGRLTGVITGLDGLYDLQFQLLEGRTVVGAVSLPMAIGAFPARLLAGYEALLETAEGVPLGMVRLAIGKPGAWSGNVTIAGQPRRAAKGSFSLLAGEQKAEVVMAFKATRVLPELRVRLVVDADSALVEGGVLSGLSADVDARGLRLAGFGGSVPVTRRMNMALDAGDQDGVNYPGGIGWARGTVTNRGAVNLRGQLGDGQSAAFAMRMGANGQAMMWVQPYRNKSSFLGGVMSVPDLGQPTPMPDVLEVGALWLKEADTREKAYAVGFAEPLALDVMAAGYVPVRNGVELAGYLGLTGGVLSWEIEGSGLSSSEVGGPLLPQTFELLNNFNLTTLAPTGAVPWRGKLGRADGGLAGTLTLTAGPENLAGRAAVSGVLLPGMTDFLGGGLVRVPVDGVRGAFRTAPVILKR